MSRKTNVSVYPPLGGVSRAVGFQAQPPFTSYDSVNFWPRDVFTGRAIMATRPPIVSAASPGVGVNLLSRVNGVAEGKPFQSMLCAQDGDLYWWDGDSWVAATGAQAGSAQTEVPLYSSAFLAEVFIPQFGDKPIVFDYVTGAAATLVETAGTCPSDNRMFVAWQGALWQAGSLTSPHILYGSRTGDAHDYNFAAPITDEGGAFFTGGENEGLLAGPITALIPLTSDTMLVSTTEGLIAFRGHPRRGGVAEEIGSSWVMGQGAWTKGPGDTAFFLTRMGIMSIGPDANAVPTPVSREKVPDDLIGLAYNYENPVVSMAYDSRWNGILITVRGDQGQAWWYDLSAGGFHKMTMEGYPYILQEFFPFVTTNKSGILICGDGYGGIGQFDRFGGETFESTAIIGPVQISPSTHEGAIIPRAVFTFGGSTPTGDGTISVSCGLDGEDAVNRAVNGGEQFSVALSTLKNNNGVCYPRAKGHALAIKVQVETGRLAFEQASFNIVSAGLNRMTRFAQTAGVTCFGYVTATPILSPESPLEDGFEMVNMDLFPEEWWDLATDSGGNIRVSDTSNNFLPFDLIGYERTDSFDARTDNGCLVLRRPISDTPEPVRIWVCDESLAMFPVGSTFGQYNAYPPWVLAFWPNNYGPSRTNVSWDMSDGFTPATPDLLNPFSGLDAPSDTFATPDDCDEVPPGAFIVACIAFPADAESGRGLYIAAENTSPCTIDISPSAVAAWAFAHNDPEQSEIGAVRLASSTYTVLDDGPNSPDIESNVPFVGQLLLGAVGSFAVHANESTFSGGGLEAEPHPTIAFSGLTPGMDAEAVENAFDPQQVYNMDTAAGMVATDAFDAVVMGFILTQIADNAAYWGEWSFVESQEQVGA